MRKLLSANFSRLWKSKAFFGMEAAIVIWGMIVYILAIYNTGNLGQEWIIKRANTYYYQVLMYSAGAIAIFCAQFFGTEYEQGTLRNKISVGHSRETIYLSNLIVTAVVGVIFSVSHVLTSFVAVPFVGIEIITVAAHNLWRYLCWVLIIVVYAALFTLLAMLDSNKARNVLISLLLALVFVFAGIFVFGKMSEPEFVSRWVTNDMEQFVLEENVLNTSYLRGSIRTVFDWWYAIMPSSQGMHIMDRDCGFDVRMPICSVILVISLTTLGITLFTRKDIK